MASPTSSANVDVRYVDEGLNTHELSLSVVNYRFFKNLLQVKVLNSILFLAFIALKFTVHLVTSALNCGYSFDCKWLIAHSLNASDYNMNVAVLKLQPISLPSL